MLSFTTSLTKALTKTATQSYWLLRLYYNDESAYTGISDKTRTVGGVIYYGIANWGSHNQTLHIDQFRASNGTMQVGLSNAPNKIPTYIGRLRNVIQSINSHVPISNEKLFIPLITNHEKQVTKVNPIQQVPRKNIS